MSESYWRKFEEHKVGIGSRILGVLSFIFGIFMIYVSIRAYEKYGMGDGLGFCIAFAGVGIVMSPIFFFDAFWMPNE